MRVLVTRPAEDAGELARRVEALGAEPVVFPLTRIEMLPLPPVDWDGVAAIIATSKNALRALGGSDQLTAARRRPVFCTGKGTAKMARSLQFADVREGPGTAAGLPDTIVQHLPPGAGKLRYLAGEHLAFDLESALGERGYTLQKIVCYTAEAATEFSAAILDEFRAQRLDAVILMSPRGAKIFDDLIAAHNLRENAVKLRAYCLSDAVAKALHCVEAGRKRIASRPDVESLLALLRSDMMQDDTTVSQY
jgi:uroporphyrinogen-III synthase